MMWTLEQDPCNLRASIAWNSYTEIVSCRRSLRVNGRILRADHNLADGDWEMATHCNVVCSLLINVFSAVIQKAILRFVKIELNIIWNSFESITIYCLLYTKSHFIPIELGNWIHQAIRHVAWMYLLCNQKIDRVEIDDPNTCNYNEFISERVCWNLECSVCLGVFTLQHYILEINEIKEIYSRKHVSLHL